MIKKVRIFGRKDNTATKQVKEVLSCFKEITFETDFAETSKNEFDSRLLTDSMFQHLLIQESFDALLENRADIVIHPAKDLPYPLNDKLEVIALTDTPAGKNKGKSGEPPFETHPLQGNVVVVAKRNNEPLRKLFGKIDIRKNFGKVYLAGFGPGDPELMTIKTNKVLSEADIIFYDDLLDSTLRNITEKKYMSGSVKENTAKIRMR